MVRKKKFLFSCWCLCVLWLQQTCSYNAKSWESTNSHQQVSSVHEEGIDQPQHCVCSLCPSFMNKQQTYGATSVKSHGKTSRTHRKISVSSFIAMEPRDLLAHFPLTECLTNIVPLCLMNDTCLHLHWVYVLVSR